MEAWDRFTLQRHLNGNGERQRMSLDFLFPRRWHFQLQDIGQRRYRTRIIHRSSLWEGKQITVTNITRIIIALLLQRTEHPNFKQTSSVEKCSFALREVNMCENKDTVSSIQSLPFTEIDSYLPFTTTNPDGLHHTRA